MIGKFTTNKLEEYKKNPDLIYISPANISTLNGIRLTKIRHCRECNRVLKNGENIFCSIECSDDNYVKTFKEVKCKYCDNNVLPILCMQKGVELIKGWRTVCDECKQKQIDNRAKIKEYKKPKKVKTILLIEKKPRCIHCNKKIEKKGYCSSECRLKRKEFNRVQYLKRYEI